MDTPDHNTREGQIAINSILAARLWPNADMEDPGECWEWDGSRTNGYGVLNLYKTQYYAHRVAYRLTHGEIPEPQINHLCDNKCCVNPTHLYPGTQSDNMKDSYERNEKVRETIQKYKRDAYSEGHQGENHHGSKLTADDVRDIREKLSEGADRGDLAEEYDVHRVTIGNIARKDTWAHV